VTPCAGKRLLASGRPQFDITETPGVPPHPPMKRIIPVVALLFLPLASFAETVDLGLHGTLTMAVPKGWTVTTQKEEDSGFAITLSPTGPENAKCLMNIAYVPDPKPVAKEEIDEKVLSVSDQFVDASVEKQKVLRPFTLTNGAFGSYCVFTDASLVGKPAKHDEFKVIGIGIIRFRDDLMAAVSIAADDEKGPDFAAMLAAVSGATVSRK
jgi:hypothetical protein